MLRGSTAGHKFCKSCRTHRFPAVVLLRLHLEDNDLIIAVVLQNLGVHLSACVGGGKSPPRQAFLSQAAPNTAGNEQAKNDTLAKYVSQVAARARL